MGKRSKEIHGTSGDVTRRWFVDWFADWPDLNPWHRFNWRTFRFIKFEFEIEHMTGRAELEVAVLGLGFTVTYVYNTEFAYKMMSMKDRIIADLKAESGNPDIKVMDPGRLLDGIDDSDFL